MTMYKFYCRWANQTQWTSCFILSTYFWFVSHFYNTHKCPNDKVLCDYWRWYFGLIVNIFRLFQIRTCNFSITDDDLWFMVRLFLSIFFSRPVILILIVKYFCEHFSWNNRTLIKHFKLTQIIISAKHIDLTWINYYYI